MFILWLSFITYFRVLLKKLSPQWSFLRSSSLKLYPHHPLCAPLLCPYLIVFWNTYSHVRDENVSFCLYIIYSSFYKVSSAKAAMKSQSLLYPRHLQQGLVPSTSFINGFGIKMLYGMCWILYSTMSFFNGDSYWGCCVPCRVLNTLCTVRSPWILTSPHYADGETEVREPVLCPSS